MQAKEIMTSDPKTVRKSDTLETAARIMRDADVGLVPVVDGGNGSSVKLVGVITDRDIAIRHVAEGHGPGHKVEEAMSTEGLTTCHPDDDVDKVMEAMRAAQVRRVPVVQDGALVGIVSQADLALDSGEDRAVGETVESISRPVSRP